MKMRLLLALLLAGCSNQGADLVADCHVERVAEVPLAIRQGALLVPARVAGHAVTMMLDTGAERSLLVPDQAAAARLTPLRARATIQGTSGPVSAPTVMLHGLEFGRFEFAASQVAVADLPIGIASDPPIAGLIGGEILSSFDLDFDFPNRRLGLYTVQDCGADFAPIKTPHVTVELLRTRNHRFLVPVGIDGHRVNALFDTGANASRITAEAARSAGVTPSDLAHDQAATSRGVGRLATRAVLHRFETITIGGVPAHEIPLAVAGRPLDEADMLLGLDYMRARHIWLSYATRRAFIEEPQ